MNRAKVPSGVRTILSNIFDPNIHFNAAHRRVREPHTNVTNPPLGRCEKSTKLSTNDVTEAYVDKPKILIRFLQVKRIHR